MEDDCGSADGPNDQQGPKKGVVGAKID